MENRDNDGFDCLGAEDIGGFVDDYKTRTADETKANMAYATAYREPADLQRTNGYQDPKTGRWVYAAVGARHCGASGMTVWHYLFFLLLFLVIAYAPSVYVYLKRYRAVRSSRKSPTDWTCGPDAASQNGGG